MDHVSLNKYICRTNSDREKCDRSVQQHVSYKGQLLSSCNDDPVLHVSQSLQITGDFTYQPKVTNDK